MRSLRFFHFLQALLIKSAILLAASLTHAQSFEGTLYFAISTHGMTSYDSMFGLEPTDVNTSLDISFKGEKFLMHFQDSLIMYGDHGRRKLTLVRSGGGKKGIEMDLVNEGYLLKNNADEPTTIKPLNKKRTISGLECEGFAISSEASGESEWWMTRSLTKQLQPAVLSAFWHASVTAKAPRPRNEYYGSDPFEDLLAKGYIPVEMDTKFGGQIRSISTLTKYEEKKIDDAVITAPADLEIISIPTH